MFILEIPYNKYKNMAGSIFNALNNSSDKNGKFGFVVTTMQQTLESLQLIQQSMNQKPMAGGLTTYSMGTDGVTPVYNPGSLVGGDPAHATALVNSTIGGKLDGSGYVVNGYSAQAELVGYGALDYSDDLEINGELKSCFTIVSPQIGSQQMQQGIDCTGVVKMLPNKDKFNPDVIKTLEKFQYGLAVDVEKFVVPFFKRYFGKIDWTKDKIISLMSKRLLYAYITSDGFNGFLPVTVDYQQAMGTPFKIFLPHQWLISTDNGVSIKAKINGEDKTLSSDNCLYLTESDGTLVSTPSTLCEEMQQKEYVESEYVSTNFRTKTGLVRFYLYDLGQVEKEIIGEVPEEYEQSLVDNSIIDSNPMPLSGGGDLSQACAKFAEQIGNKLTAQQIEIAEAKVAEFESSGNWGAWSRQDANEGASIGRHQMSSKAGNVLEYLNIYKQLGGTVSDGFYAEAVSASKTSGRVDGNRMFPYKSEFEAQSKTSIGRNAQLMVYFNGIKGKFAAKWFNELQCTTTIELSSIMGSINHYPYGLNTIFEYYKDQIKDKPLPLRAILIEKCHMVANYIAKSRGVGSTTKRKVVEELNVNLSSISLNEPKISTWRYRHSSMLSMAYNQNYDMR